MTVEGIGGLSLQGGYSLVEIASLALAMTMDNSILFRREPIAPEQKIASLRSQ